MTTAAPAALALKDVYALPIDRVHPNPDNPRRITDDHPSLPGMAETMKALGQLQPIVARPTPDGHWMILAGERRWRAARMAGLASIEAKVVDVDDQTAFEMTVVENLQRNDLHWLEEARGVEAMVKRGWDVATIAGHIGKSEAWVRLRAKLASISPAWRKAVEKVDGQFHGWPASMLELIARFPIETQESLLKGDNWQMARCSSAAELQKYLDHEVTRALKRAPWDLNDAKLVAKAGACSACPKRSSCQQQLFAESADDRCLDADCWKTKAEAHVVVRVAVAKKEHPKAIVIGSSYEAPKPLQKQVQSEYSFRQVKADTKGAVPAIYATGEKAGQLVYVAKASSGSSGGSAAKKGAAMPKDQLADHVKRRARHAIEALVAKLGGESTYGDIKPAAADVREPGADVMLAIVLTFGVDGDSSVWSPDWKMFQKTRGLKGDELRAELWRSCRIVLVSVLESSLNARGRDEIDVAGAETIARLCGVDWRALTDAARDALPLPKKLAEQFTEDGKPLKALTGKRKPPAKSKASATAAKA